MTSGKIKAVLFIIVFLLIVAVVCSWVINRDAELRGDALQPAGQGDAEVTAPPIPTPGYSSDGGGSGASQQQQQSGDQPAPAQIPAPTPEPTPIPTPEPTPVPTYGESLGSGTFSSETGLGLDLLTDWSVTTVSADQISVTLKVSIRSYSLYTSALPNAVNMNVGGQYVSATSPAISYDGNGQITTEVCTQTFTVNAPVGNTTVLPIEVIWHFGGVYHGESLPTLECGGTLNIAR